MLPISLESGVIMSATGWMFFFGSYSHYRKLLPISIESGVIKSELMIVEDSFLFLFPAVDSAPADEVKGERHADTPFVFQRLALV